MEITNEWASYIANLYDIAYYKAYKLEDSYENIYQQEFYDYFFQMCAREKYYGDKERLKEIIEQEKEKPTRKFLEMLIEYQERFDSEQEAKIALLNKLPKTILATVEDIRMLALGFMTKETMIALRKYLKTLP